MRCTTWDLRWNVWSTNTDADVKKNAVESVDAKMFILDDAVEETICAVSMSIVPI